MKWYKLLKDLPFAKAGEELCFKHDEETGYFTLYKDLNKMSVGDLHEGFIENFDEWFEEVKEIKVPDEFYVLGIYADKMGITTHKVSDVTPIHRPLYFNNLSVGLAFKTEEEAKKHIEYLKAKEIIKQDAKGFKYDWKNNRGGYYFGVWDYEDEEPYADGYTNMGVQSIRFRKRKDIEESFEKHPEEWKTYLTYEQ